MTGNGLEERMTKRDEIVAILRDADAGTLTHCQQMADRILACVAMPTEAMVEAALSRMWDSKSDETLRQVTRAALIAAAKAMGGDDGKR